MKTLWAILIVCALFSLPMLRVQGFDPDAYSWILLEIPSSGLSPGELEESTRPLLGRQLIKIPGIMRVYQACSHGGTFFQLQYPAEIDSVYMLSKLHQIYIGIRNQLPFGTGPARISWIEKGAPALSLVFRMSKATTDETILALQELREEVHRIPAVHAVQIKGIPRKEAEVVLQPAALRAAEISPLDVLQSVQDSLYDTSIGTWDDGRRKTDLYARSAIRSIHDLGLISVHSRGDDREHFCLLQELAEISWSGPLYDEDLRIRGNRGYLLEIDLSSEASLFQKSQSIQEIKSLLRSKSTITELENLYDSTEHLPALILWSLFSLLFAHALFPKERFLMCSAAFAAATLLYSLSEHSLTPSAMIGLAVGLLMAAGLLHISKSPSSPTFFFFALILPSYYMLLSFLLFAGYALRLAFWTWLLNCALSLFFCLLFEGIHSRFSPPPFLLPLRKPKLFSDLVLALLIATAAVLECGFTLQQSHESIQCRAFIHPASRADLSATHLSVASLHSHFLDKSPQRTPICTENDFIVSLSYSGKKVPDPGNNIAYWLYRTQAEFSLLCCKGRQIVTDLPRQTGSISLHPSLRTGQLSRLFAFLGQQDSQPSHSNSRWREFNLQLLHPLVPGQLSRREIFLHVELALEGKVAGELQLKDRVLRAPVRIWYGKTESRKDLAVLPIFTTDGGSIELQEISRIQASGPQNRLFRIYRGRDK